MGCGIAEIEIDSAAYDVVYDDVLTRGAKSQRALVFENMARVLQLFQVALVKFCPFTLQIGPEVAAYVRAFIPIQAQPSESFVDGSHCFLGIALRIGVFDA